MLPAGASHHAQPVRAAEQLVGDPCRASSHERVVFSDPLQQLRGGKGRKHVHGKLGLGREQCYAIGVDFVGDEDTVGHRAVREGRTASSPGVAAEATRYAGCRRIVFLAP